MHRVTTWARRPFIAAASVVLALIGVYAITRFSIGRRAREIAIRLTLGARPARVVGSVLAGEWLVIVVGLAIGASGAVLVSRVVSAVAEPTS